MVATKGFQQQHLVAMMALLLFVLTAPVGVRADTVVRPENQARVDRVTIGLVARGLPIVAVLSFSIGYEDCLRADGDYTVKYSCIGKAATDNNIPLEVVVQSLGATGTWSATFGVCTPQCGSYQSGKIAVGQAQQGRNPGGTPYSTYAAHMTYTKGGTADLELTSGSNSDYNFTWSNSFGQSGTGFLVWTGPCFLYGLYFDAKDATNSGIIVFRRC